MMDRAAVPSRRRAQSEAHLCDNLSHLLVACADLAAPPDLHRPRPLILYIDDRVPLDEALRWRLAELTGAEIRRMSDSASIDAYASLPGWMPDIVRRNVAWRDGLQRPWDWIPPTLADREFDVGYVYNAGFFFSKVIAGRCRRTVLRDSGYANYVRHDVPWRRAIPRLVAGRSPRHQVWGEERWIDEIQVVRPDRVPPRVRDKATRLALDELMSRLPPDRARAVAGAFWGGHRPPRPAVQPSALVITQPIDQLGMCSTDAKFALYASIADRLRRKGLSITVKPHHRELATALPGDPHIPAAFPIEGWTWIGQPAFDLAVSLNSAALADSRVGFAHRHFQLIAPERFYARDWDEWEPMIDSAFSANAAELKAATTQTPSIPPAPTPATDHDHR